MVEQTKLLTAKEAAKALNVHLNTIYRWSRTGYLPAFKFGGGKTSMWKVKQEDVDKILEGKK